MSERPVHRYNPRRSRESADSYGTEAERRAWWVLHIGADAYDYGYDRGIRGIDPDGVGLGRDIDSHQYTPPHLVLRQAYARGWKAGRKAASGHPVQ